MSAYEITRLWISDPASHNGNNSRPLLLNIPAASFCGATAATPLPAGHPPRADQEQARRGLCATAEAASTRRLSRQRLKAARLDRSHDEELRKLVGVDLLIIDDFALTKLDQTETQDVYEIVVERHLRASTIVTSNREPGEWLAVMADPLLAQSAIDRLQSAAYELVVEGDSYRRRQKPRRTG